MGAPILFKNPVKTNSLIRALSIVALAAASMHAATPAQAVYTYDSLISNYNLITFGNATIKNYYDTEGALAVGGNLCIDGGKIATNFPIGAVDSPTLYVGGKLFQGNGSKFKTANGLLMGSNGVYLSLGSGFSTIVGKNVAATTISGQPLPKDWLNPTLQKNQFLDISSTLNLAVSNSSITKADNKLIFNSGISSGVAVFKLDLSLAKYKNLSNLDIEFDGSADTTYVVDVTNSSGSTLFDSNSIHFVHNGNLDNILWNFVDDSHSTNDHVTIGGTDFFGSILAPTFSVSNTATSRIDGQVVADSFYYNGQCLSDSHELHYIGFEADLPPTPEPSTYGLIGAGFCIGLAGVRRWRKQRVAGKAA